jgi:hypothetical protein
MGWYSMADFHDMNWYPMILVGRTGSEVPREQVIAKSKITKEIQGESKVSKEVRVSSKVVP